MDDYPLDSIANGAQEYVFTTHIKHQEQFFVHVESRSKILDDIMESLATRYMDLGPEDKILHNTRLGGLCAAKFTDDNNWYRAKITGLVKNGLIEVQFVDYGNTDYVSEDRVKVLDQDLVQYPVQSYRCALAGVSCAQGYWPPELMVQFEDRVMDRRCLAVFLGKREHDEVYLLEMYDEEGNNLNQMFGAQDFEPGLAFSSNAIQDAHSGAGLGEKVWDIGATYQATVVYIKNPGLFWCQETAYTNELLILSEELSRLHMTQSIKPVKNVTPGMVCAAKFSVDEAWYRGIVQNVSHKSAQVYFVDYGNTETIGLDFICDLRPEMRTLPSLAVKCCMANVINRGKDWAPKLIEKFEELVLDKEFEVNVVRKNGDVHQVTLLDIVENQDAGNQLQRVIDSGQFDTQSRGEVPRNVLEPRKEPTPGPTLSVGRKAHVFLSWIENPGEFWVQQSESEPLLENLSQQLQECYSKPQPSAPSAAGAFVVAKFSEDQMWYRGLVMKDLDDGHVQVLFLDYGNSDFIPKEELKQVHPAFENLTPQATRCALAGVKPLRKGDNSWTTDAKDFLESLCENGCDCIVVGETNTHKLVKLIAKGKDVASEMVALHVVSDNATTAPKPQVPTFLKEVQVRKADQETVIVTHVESPQQFYCQLAKNNPALDELMEKLGQHYSDEGGTPLKDPVLGQACIAQYSADNSWYRASLIGMSPSGFDVLFVDYGNTEFVSGHAVCEPEPRFLDVPVQAVQCSLPVTGELEYLTSVFSDLVLEKEVVMEVFDIVNSTAIVELYDGQTQMSEYLKSAVNSTTLPEKSRSMNQMAVKSIPAGTTVSAFTSVVVSPNKFFLQVAGVDEELGALMDSIALKYVSDDPPPSLTNPQVGQDCVALYSEDNHWYRGKILSVQGNSSTILFVDYGNEENVSNNNIKTLTPDLASVPIMAYQCSLSGCEESAWTASAKEFFENLVMDKELTCTFVNRSSVKISSEGKDILTALSDAGFGKTVPTQVQQDALPASSGWDESDVSPRKGQGLSEGFGGNQRDRGKPRRFGDHCDRDSDSFHGNRRESNESSFGGNRSRGESGGFGARRNERETGFRDGRVERDSTRGRDKGFDGRRGGEGDAGFGGGHREKKLSSNSSESSATEFIYDDPPADSEKAILVHMDEDGTFYLQLPSMEREILFLAKRLAGSYKNGGPRLRDQAMKGTICCAKFAEDGNMYRSKVEDIAGGNVVVRYVDYGNTAECSLNDLKVLFPDLLQYPVQAFPCKLRGWKWSLSEAKKFAAATLDKDLTVTFTSTTRPYEVDLETPEGDVLNIMTGKSISPAKKLSPKSSGFGNKSPPGGFVKSPNARSGGGFGASTPKKGGRNLDFDEPRQKAVAYPKQEFLAQKAPQGDQTAFISHIGEDGYFCLQLEKDIEMIERFSDKLAALPRSEHPNVSIGSACAAVFSEDSVWYRARIRAINGDKLRVIFVDYGNGDSVDRAGIKPLTSELLQYTPLAYQCQFPDIGPLSPEQQGTLSQYLMEHQVTVAFSGQTPPFYVAVLTNDEKDLQEIVCPSNQYRSQLVPKEVTPVGVPHIKDDGRFYLQLYKDQKVMKAFHADLQSTFSTKAAEKIGTPEPGMPCCVKSQDGTWHRGKILEIAGASVHVLHVDTGTSETVDASSLFFVPAEFLKQPPFALECRLKGVESWAGDLREKFLDMTQDKILNATFYTQTAPYRVSLARSIELDLLGLAAPVPDSPEKSPEKIPESSITVKDENELQRGVSSYISHVEENGIFYTQAVAKEEALISLAEELETLLSNSTCLSSAEVGDVVCAKFTEDDAWYRAKVEVCTEDDQYRVRFLDYGNTDIVGADRLTSLPDSVNLSVAPAFATKCRLAGVSKDLTLVQADKMRDLVLDKVVIVETISEQDEVHEAEVLLEGVSLAETLDCKTQVSDPFGSEDAEHAYISQVESDGTFYIQKVARESALNDLADKLEIQLESSEPPNDVSLGSVMCARFTEDDAWYRAIVESVDEEGQFVVRFVDYGNTDRVDKDRLAAMPDSVNMSLIAPFASKCQFAGVSAALSIEQVDKLREMVTDKVVMVSFKTEKDGLLEVDVSLEGQSLLKRMEFNNNSERNTPEKTSHNEEYDKPACHSSKRLALRANESQIMPDLHHTTGSGDKDLDKTTDSTDKEDFVDAVESIGDTADSAKERDLFEDAIVDVKERNQDMTGTEETPQQAEQESSETTEKALENILITVKSGQRERVTITHVESPDVFYLQLCQNEAILDEMMNHLFEYCSTLPDGDAAVKDLNVGDICAAHYEDESWYRVQVENVDEDGTFKMFFFDYGNTEPADNSALRQLPEKFKSQPPMALKAKLGGISPVGETWAQEAIDDFKSLVEEKTLLADIIEAAVDGGECVVRLLELGIPVHEELIKKGHAIAGEDLAVSKTVQQVFSDNDSQSTTKAEDFSGYLESTHLEGDDETAKQTMMTSGAHAQQRIGCVSSSLEELKEEMAFVSHFVSPSLFWCQLASATDSLSKISETLQAVYSTPKEEDKISSPLSAGDIVVAKFLEDEQFYRAKVLTSSVAEEAVESDQEENIAVRFIDFGNESETPKSEVYHIRDDLCTLPAQAICCSLDKIQPVEESWSPEACTKFGEIVTDQELSLKLVGREQGGKVLVDLVIMQTSQSVSAILVDASFAKGGKAEVLVKSTARSLSMTKPGDVSEIESLEITQPIMESTAMVADNTQSNVTTYSFEDPEEGFFRSIHLSQHTEYDVFVSNEESPSIFHVQLRELSAQYESLMAEIGEHIVSDSCVETSEFSPKVGEVCLVQHCGIWYRGEIVLQKSGCWHVRSVDCGWEARVSAMELKPLPERFLSLPAQAIPCYLAGIVSVEPEWCTNAVTFFIDCVKDAKLCMYVLENADDGKYGVYISDNKDTDSQSVNRAMVELGYAEVVPGSNIEVQIEMEKTLDTDMLNELEESFNEVSILKYNAHCDSGNEVINSVSKSERAAEKEPNATEKPCQNPNEAGDHRLVNYENSVLEVQGKKILDEQNSLLLSKDMKNLEVEGSDEGDREAIMNTLSNGNGSAERGETKEKEQQHEQDKQSEVFTEEKTENDKHKVTELAETVRVKLSGTHREDEIVMKSKNFKTYQLKDKQSDEGSEMMEESEVMDYEKKTSEGSHGLWNKGESPNGYQGGNEEHIVTKTDAELRKKVDKEKHDDVKDELQLEEEMITQSQNIAVEGGIDSDMNSEGSKEDVYASCSEDEEFVPASQPEIDSRAQNLDTDQRLPLESECQELPAGNAEKDEKEAKAWKEDQINMDKVDEVPESVKKEADTEERKLVKVKNGAELGQGGKEMKSMEIDELIHTIKNGQETKPQQDVQKSVSVKAEDEEELSVKHDNKKLLSKDDSEKMQPVSENREAKVENDSKKLRTGKDSERMSNENGFHETNSVKNVDEVVEAVEDEDKVLAQNDEVRNLSKGSDIEKLSKDCGRINQKPVEEETKATKVDGVVNGEIKLVQHKGEDTISVVDVNELIPALEKDAGKQNNQTVVNYEVPKVGKCEGKDKEISKDNIMKTEDRENYDQTKSAIETEVFTTDKIQKSDGDLEDINTGRDGQTSANSEREIESSQRECDETKLTKWVEEIKLSTGNSATEPEQNGEESARRDKSDTETISIKYDKAKVHEDNKTRTTKDREINSTQGNGLETKSSKDSRKVLGSKEENQMKSSKEANQMKSSKDGKCTKYDQTFNDVANSAKDKGEETTKSDIVTKAIKCDSEKQSVNNDEEMIHTINEEEIKLARNDKQTSTNDGDKTELAKDSEKSKTLKNDKEVILADDKEEKNSFKTNEGTKSVNFDKETKSVLEDGELDLSKDEKEMKFKMDDEETESVKDDEETFSAKDAEDTKSVKDAKGTKMVKDNKETKLAKDDDETNSAKDDEETKSENDDEETRSARDDDTKPAKDDEETKSAKDDEEIKSENDDEETRSARDDDTKPAKDDEETKSANDDEEIKPPKDDRETKSAKDEEETKPPKDHEENKSAKDDKETKSAKDDEETKSAKNDEETISAKDDEETSSAKDDEQTKSAKDDETKSAKNDEQTKFAIDDEEIKSAMDDEEDEETKSEKGNKKSKTVKDNEENKSGKSDEENKSVKGDEKTKSVEGDEIKSGRDAKETQSAKDGGETKSAKDVEGNKSANICEETKSAKDDAEIKSGKDGGETKSASGEESTLVNDMKKTGVVKDDEETEVAEDEITESAKADKIAKLSKTDQVTNLSKDDKETYSREYVREKNLAKNYKEAKSANYSTEFASIGDEKTAVLAKDNAEAKLARDDEETKPKEDKGSKDCGKHTSEKEIEKLPSGESSGRTNRLAKHNQRKSAHKIRHDGEKAPKGIILGETFSAASQALLSEFVACCNSVDNMCNVVDEIVTELMEVRSGHHYLMSIMRNDLEIDERTLKEIEEGGLVLLDMEFQVDDQVTQMVSIFNDLKSEVCKLQQSTREHFGGNGKLCAASEIEEEQYNIGMQRSGDFGGKEKSREKVIKTCASPRKEHSELHHIHGTEQMKSDNSELQEAAAWPYGECIPQEENLNTVLQQFSAESKKKLEQFSAALESNSSSSTHSSPNMCSENYSSPKSDSSGEKSAFCSCLEDVEDQNLSTPQACDKETNDGQAAQMTEQSTDDKSGELRHIAGDMNEPNMNQVDDTAGSVCSSGSGLGAVSLDTTTEEYESCTEAMYSEEEFMAAEAGNDHFFADSSIGSQQQKSFNDESTYDTSSLVFSDSCNDSSVSTSRLEASTTDMSTLDSQTDTSQTTPADSQDSSTNSSLSNSKSSSSTCRSASTAITSVGSAVEELLANTSKTPTDDSISDLDPFDLSGLNTNGISNIDGNAYDADVSQSDSAPPGFQETSAQGELGQDGCPTKKKPDVPETSDVLQGVKSDSELKSLHEKSDVNCGAYEVSSSLLSDHEEAPSIPQPSDSDTSQEKVSSESSTSKSSSSSKKVADIGAQNEPESPTEEQQATGGWGWDTSPQLLDISENRVVRGFKGHWEVRERTPKRPEGRPAPNAEGTKGLADKPSVDSINTEAVEGGSEAGDHGEPPPQSDREQMSEKDWKKGPYCPDINERRDEEVIERSEDIIESGIWKEDHMKMGHKVTDETISNRAFKCGSECEDKKKKYEVDKDDDSDPPSFHEDTYETSRQESSQDLGRSEAKVDTTCDANQDFDCGKEEEEMPDDEEESKDVINSDNEEEISEA